MTKFLIITGLIFGTLLAIVLGIYGIIITTIKVGEFLDNIERKYGFKGSMIAFLVLMAIASVAGAAILTFAGV